MSPIQESTSNSESRPSDRDWQSLVPNHWYARRGHRWFDRVLLLALLPPALPLMFAIACVNALVFGSWRQVFFVQPRIGYRGASFDMLKFRTMKESGSSAMGSWSTGGDQLRVTKFGRLLRQTHLDELPQLFNIMRGEMSFIGPRPEMVEIEAWANEHVPGFSDRLAIRPGVAGFAQITQGYTGRSVEAYAQKLEINMEYAEQMSFLFDVQILLRTIHWMSCGKGWMWTPPDNHGDSRSDAQESAASVEASEEPAQDQVAA